MSAAGRVSGLEREAAHLRVEAVDRDHENGELRECVALQETNARLHNALDDNVGFPHLLFTSSRLPAHALLDLNAEPMEVEPPLVPAAALRRQPKMSLVATQRIFHGLTFRRAALVRAITTGDMFGLSIFSIAAAHRLWSLVNLAA
jgi:hypothetical protein